MLPEISEIIRRRKLLGLTQLRLSQEAGISQPSLNRIERGKMAPSYEAAKRVFEALERLEHANEPKAKDKMCRKVIFLSPKDSIKKAAAIMKVKSISQIPIVENGIIIGTVTYDSIFSSGSDYYSPVPSAMTDPLPAVPETTSISAIRLLLKEHPAVLLLKGRKLSGIITKEDLI